MYAKDVDHVAEISHTFVCHKTISRLLKTSRD